MILGERLLMSSVGLKSKMHSLITVDGEEIKKVNGVNKNVVDSIRPC